MSDMELEAFKVQINLCAYIAAQGYQRDPRASSSSSAVMRHPNGDKIIITRAAWDGHYMYFSVRDERDNGTIIDWIQNRDRVSIGVVRKILRPWLSAPQAPIPILPPLAKSSKNRLKVEVAFGRMQDATRHPYLEDERAIPASLLQSARFMGRVRIEAKYGNAIFPHFDVEGLSGYEIKNKNFTGYSPGGCKALWLSHECDSDHRLVFCESAIDALSYAALQPSEHTRFASLGGNPSPLQLDLIQAAIARMPENAEIISAMDADVEGAKLAEVIRNAVKLSSRGDMRFIIEEPCEFKDWNDELRASVRKRGSAPLLPP